MTTSRAPSASQTTMVTKQTATPPVQPAQKAEAEKQALKVSASPQAEQSLLQAPAVTISAAKQQQLADLLARYKADKITPEEYHTERAKILAEP